MAIKKHDACFKHNLSSYVDVGDAYMRFPMSYDTSNVAIYS